MKTTTYFRRANIAKAAALNALLEKMPDVDLVSFETKRASADDAATQRFTKGELIFAATIREAEFPPKDDEGGETEETSEAPPADDGGDEPEAKDDSEGNEGGDDGAGNPFGGDKGEVKPKKMSPDEEIVHLLTEILHALKGGGGPDLGPGGPDDLAGGDLPDVGAPPAGGALPPPGKAPLPPPIEKKAPMGTPFSHYDPRVAEIVSIRVDANKIGNKKMIEEARVAYPTHKVAKIQRTGSAELNGKRYNLPENNVAVVTLIKG